MTTGVRLREQRERSGLTLGQVGTYEDLTAQYLSNLELGKNSPNVWLLLARLATRYRCSTDYLLGLTDDPTPAGQASELQQIYNRLSADRQADLIEIAQMWLSEEDSQYAAQWLGQRVRSNLNQGALDALNDYLDEAYDSEEDENSSEDETGTT